VNVDTMTFPARDGDVFLLCSDGLTTMVSDEEIREILAGSKSLRSAVSKLIDAANRGGGRDNITAVAFRVAAAAVKPEDESPTLISRTAEQAGLTRERVRDAGDRLRGQGSVPTPRRRRRILGWIVAAVAAIVIIGGGILAIRSVYFLGTDQDGNVAVYRGLPYQLPLGINLYSKQYSIPIQVGTLSEERQRAVTGHEWRSKADASDLADNIKLHPAAGLPPPPPPPPKKKKKAAAANKKKQAQKR
jgi:protein phosphatase